MNQRFLYYFNPDHDQALANNDLNYMSPESSRQMGSDLAVLPIWFADKYDAVLAPSPFNKRFIDEMRECFPDLPYLVTETEVLGRGYTPVPWGWDPAVKKKFKLMGISEEIMPTEKQMAAIREFSSRKWAVELLSELTTDDNSYCGESFYFTHLEEIKQFVESYPRSVLKMPISGSGKGLNWCRGHFSKRIENWCENVLMRQGGVVGEPQYDKVKDFSMQFKVDELGKASFVGYSIFDTNPSGAYVGNVLAANECMHVDQLSYLPQELLTHTCEVLEKKITEKLDGAYTGYLGVDMMVCHFKEGRQFRLHPCVEVNLRMNMGMLSRLFYEKYVNSDNVGRFYLEYFSSTTELFKNHKELIEMYPLRIENGKFISGYLPLTPVTPHCQYTSWVII